jgi:hypothetical protein
MTMTTTSRVCKPEIIDNNIGFQAELLIAGSSEVKIFNVVSLVSADEPETKIAE